MTLHLTLLDFSVEIPTKGDIFVKCPYCCEDIDEGAVVCPRCRRDLAFFRPIWLRLREAEDSLEALSNDISELKNRARVELRPLDVAPILALFCSVLSAFLFTWLDWLPFFNGKKWDYSLQFLSISSPFLPALVMALVLPRVRPYSSLLLGLVAGLAGEAQMLLL